MTLIFMILIILASVILGLIVLIQNPKGGGLAGNIAGFSNQFMGVKQTTDVLEKGTWIFAAIIAVLCMCSVFFIPRTEGTGPNKLQDVGGSSVPSTNQQPAGNNVQFPNTTPTKPDSPK